VKTISGKVVRHSLA